MWPWVLTDDSWGVACVSWANALQKLTLTRSMLYICMSITHIQTEPTFITKDNGVPFHSPVDFHNLQCHGVDGSLARETCDLSHAASRWFPMVLGDKAGAKCAQISFLDAVQVATTGCTMRWSWHESVLCGHPGPGLWVWECFTDHCWKQQQPPIQCAQLVQPYVDMSIQLSAGN